MIALAIGKITIFPPTVSMLTGKPHFACGKSPIFEISKAEMRGVGIVGKEADGRKFRGQST
jgi:hypothetical protein